MNKKEKIKADISIEVKISEDSKDFFEIEFIGSTPDIDHADDIVTSEAMQKSIDTYGLPKFLNSHKQSDLPLGVITDFKIVGNASVFKARIPKVKDDPFTNRLMALIKMGGFSEASIGFFTIDSEYKEHIRIIKEIELIEVSLVNIGCNRFTEILSAKARELGTDDKKLLELEQAFESILSEDEDDIEIDFKSLKEVEKFLKGLGLSNKKSTTIVSKIAELKNLSDSDAEAKRIKEQELEIEEQKKLSDSADLKSVNDFFTNLIENK